MKEVLDEGFQRHETGILGTLGVMLLGGFVSVRRYLRRRPRACEHCHQPRELLSEDADDEHLESGQRKEESIGSVDYDVWWCGRCQDALVLDYSAWFTGYSRCPSCSNRTKSSDSTTVRRATEYSEGLVRVDERCVQCSYTNSYTRVTARIERSTSSSSSYSSSSSSSSSSFGGGSSSGGGSSGSW
jgi:uncharacterized protein